MGIFGEKAIPIRNAVHIHASNMTAAVLLLLLMLFIGDALSATVLDDALTLTKNGVRVEVEPDQLDYPAEVDLRRSSAFSSSSSSRPSSKFVNTLRSSPLISSSGISKFWDRNLEINNRRAPQLAQPTSIMPLSRYRKLHHGALSSSTRNNLSRFHTKQGGSNPSIDSAEPPKLSTFSRNFTEQHLNLRGENSSVLFNDRRQALSSSSLSPPPPLSDDDTGKKMSMVYSTGADLQRLPFERERAMVTENTNKIFRWSIDDDQLADMLSSTTISSSLIPISDKWQRQAAATWFNERLPPPPIPAASIPAAAFRFQSASFDPPLNSSVVPVLLRRRTSSRAQELPPLVRRPQQAAAAALNFQQQSSYSATRDAAEKAALVGISDLSAAAAAHRRPPYSTSSTSSRRRISTANQKQNPSSVIVSHHHHHNQLNPSIAPHQSPHPQQNSIVQYSRLAPAPPLRPVSATSNNIVESIFAQSQLRRRGHIDNAAKPTYVSGVSVSDADADGATLANILRSSGGDISGSLLANPIMPTMMGTGSGNDLSNLGGSFTNGLRNLVTTSSAAANRPSFAGGTNLLDSVAQSAQSLLSSESAIDTISKFARNLLTLPISNQEVLSLLTSALSGGIPKLGLGSIGGPSSLTSSNTIVDQSASNILNAQQLFHSLTTKNISSIDSGGGVNAAADLTAAAGLSSTSTSASSKRQPVSQSHATDDIDGWLKRMPEEQRSLLEAAIQSGELDLHSINSSAIIRNSASDQSLNESSSAVILSSSETSSESLLNHSNFSASESRRSALLPVENRLIEWIQQNRARPSSARHSSAASSASTFSSTLSNTARQPNVSHTTTNSSSSIHFDHALMPSTDKLPYYGKYCGSFSEPVDAKKQFGISGAVWAVDDNHFIVSKFNFRPGALDTENVTFWAGPQHITGNVFDDMLPSVNGFYLEPKPIDLSAAFLSKRILIIQARVRGQIQGTSSSIHRDNETNTADALVEYSSGNGTAAENYLQLQATVNDSKTVASELDDAIATSSNSTTDQHMTTVADDDCCCEFASTETTEILRTKSSDTHHAPTSDSTETTASSHCCACNKSLIRESVASSSSTKNKAAAVASSRPLGWYAAAYRPLLLTLPDQRHLKQTYWLALLDHKRNQIISSVLIPNGAAFKVPASIRLRPFTAINQSASSSTRLKYAISSGPIEVIDMKTIVINNFTLETNGLAVWFMFGKDLLPNSDGHILPIYDRTVDEQQLKAFDCDSLREYSNEEVALRLPDPFDITDVFWLSVYSLAEAVSLSHLYVPYNDMHLPPDLRAIPTPRCAAWHGSK